MGNPSSTWSGRQIMRTLVGAASIAALRAANPPLRRTGIIGAGMAGVSLAWLLDGQREVLLLEAQPEIGGSVQSVAVNLDGQRFVVDLGAQYFNPEAYPTYIKLLSLLGISDEHSFATSITVFDPSETTPRFLSPLFPQRVWPLFASWNTPGIEAFATAFASAKQREDKNASWDVTMEAWLQTLHLTQQQWAGIIVPWVASLYSASIDEAVAYSARAAIQPGSYRSAHRSHLCARRSAPVVFLQFRNRRRLLRGVHVVG